MGSHRDLIVNPILSKSCAVSPAPTTFAVGQVDYQLTYPNGQDKNPPILKLFYSIAFFIIN